MDLNNFKPLLAGTVTDLEALRFPMIASPKLDGIRCVVVNGKALSRNLKSIPNKFIRESLENYFQTPVRQDNKGNLFQTGYHVDGEIMLKSGDFNNVQSAVMSFDGEPDFEYVIFDTISNKPYNERSTVYTPGENIQWKYSSLQQKQVNNIEELMKLEDEWVKQGYEGIMLRDPNGRYKFGRSTEKEQILLKLKRFHDAEATVVGFEEKMLNNNEQVKDNLGRAKRSSAKAGLVPAGTLGALVVHDPLIDKTFTVGSGFDHATLQDIWDNRGKYELTTITYKYQELSKYGVPRFPTFKCFRLS